MQKVYIIFGVKLSKLLMRGSAGKIEIHGIVHPIRKHDLIGQG